MMSSIFADIEGRVFLMNALTFSERLLEAMTIENITQAQLAARVGLTRSAINQLIMGSSKGMKPENLVRVARALRVRVEWLAIGELPMRPDHIPPADRELLQHLHSLPVAQQEALKAFLRESSSRI